MAALFFFGAAQIATAQERITPEAFLDRVVGKTMTFTDRVSGQRIGVEQFLNHATSVWATDSGRCTFGVIEIRGPYLCFIYEDYPESDNCWLPHILEDELTVLSQRTWQIQIASGYSDDPVVCEGTPIS